MKNKYDAEKILNAATSVGFIMLLVCLLILCAVIPDKVKSENENRELQQMPEARLSKILDGSYMKSFEAYASDNVVLRDVWMSVKTYTDVASGKSDNGNVYFGKDGYLFPMEDINGEQLEKNFIYTKEFIAQIKKQNADISVSVLIAPTAAEILKDKLPQHAKVPKQQKIFSAASDYFGEGFVDTSESLKGHDSEYIYYKTDHHWTSLGAYYAYAAWTQKNGIKALPVRDFHVEIASNDFYGTSYSKAVGLNKHADFIQKFSNDNIDKSTLTIEKGDGERETGSIFDKEYLKTKDKYSYFLSGNNPLSIIETPVKNGKNLLVIKDSYANSFIPFLTNHFEKIYAADLRYYKKNVNELIEKNQIDHVLILYNAVQYSNDRNLVYLTAGNK